MSKAKLITAIPMLATMVMPMTTFAATGYTTSGANTTYSDEITSDADKNTVNVNVSQASTFKVIIPKNIVLNGTKDADNSSTYVVQVTGNVASDEVVKVIPDATFQMEDEAKMKASLTATVNQPVQKFVNSVTKEKHDATKNDTSADVFGKDASGIVTVNDLSAGTWNGSFNFNVSLEKIS